MTTVHTRQGRVMLQGTGSDAVTIVEARSWWLEIDQIEGDETQGFDDVWRSIASVSEEVWSGKFEANVDMADSTAFAAIGQNSHRKLYLYPDWTGNPGRFYSGNVWLKLRVEALLPRTARYVVEFTGNGAITQS